LSNKSGRPSAGNRPGAAKAKQPQRPQQQPQRPQQQKPQQPQKQAQNRQPTFRTDSQVLTAERDGQAAARQQEKQQARLQRQAAAREEAARRKRTRTIQRVAIFGTIALAFVALVTYLALREAGKPGRLVDQQVSTHIAPGAAHADYTTDPPTSGPHVNFLPAFKVYSEPITKELQVHGLEDGAVVINYTPDLDKTSVERLGAIADIYYNKPAKQNHVIVSPYAEKFKGTDAKIALTAWRRIDYLDAYDEQRIRRFIDEYVGIDHHGESGT
jgi:hypothetical protein